VSQTVAGYFDKAKRALSGARLLLAARDTEGACNRAYFAMFDAAHAALLANNPDSPEASTKTHHQLIAAFGKNLVLNAEVDVSSAGRSTRSNDSAGLPITSAIRLVSTTRHGRSSRLKRLSRPCMQNS
jgi:uncharacterized protein (UPF0332 family)